MKEKRDTQSDLEQEGEKLAGLIDLMKNKERELNGGEPLSPGLNDKNTGNYDADDFKSVSSDKILTRRSASNNEDVPSGSISVSKEELEKHENEKSELRKELEDARKANEERSKTREKKIDELQELLKLKEQEIESFSQNSSEQVKTLQENSKKQIEEKNSNIQELESQLETMQAQFQDEKKDIRSEFEKRLKNKIADFEKKLEDATNEADADHKKQVEKLNNRFSFEKAEYERQKNDTDIRLNQLQESSAEKFMRIEEVINFCM